MAAATSDRTPPIESIGSCATRVMSEPIEVDSGAEEESSDIQKMSENLSEMALVVGTWSVGERSKYTSTIEEGVQTLSLDIAIVLSRFDAIQNPEVSFGVAQMIEAYSKIVASYEELRDVIQRLKSCEEIFED